MWREARKLVNIVYGLVKKNREFQKYIRHDDFEDLYQQAEITQKVITYLINYQKKNNPKNQKTQQTRQTQ